MFYKELIEYYKYVASCSDKKPVLVFFFCIHKSDIAQVKYIFDLGYTSVCFYKKRCDFFQFSDIVQLFLKFSKTNKQFLPSTISSLFLLKFVQNLSTVSYKGVSCKTILSAVSTTNFVNKSYLRTYYSFMEI